MNITDKLEQEELLRVLIASSLWDTREEVEDAVEKMEGFVVLSGDGKPIDEAIGDYFIDDGDIAGSVPAQWVAYIDAEAVGRDIRVSGEAGRAVDLLEDPAGGYGGDWKYFVIRDN